MLAAFAESWQGNPNHMVSRYNAACVHALLGRPKEEMKLLEVLHAAWGFRALTLLVAAASDSDLASLRSDPRFRELTTAAAPSPAWGDAMAEGARDEGVALVISDAVERLCLIRGEPDDEGKIRFRRFDCDSGQARGELSGTCDEVAATLDELGAWRWSMIAEGDSAREKVLEWVRVALAHTDEDVPLFRSPSATHVAVYLEGVHGDKRFLISKWPGQPMVAYLRDDGQGQLLSYALPAISKDGRYLVALAWQDSGLSEISLNRLTVRPTKGRTGSQSLPLQVGMDPDSLGEAAVRRFDMARSALEGRRWRQLEPVGFVLGSDWLGDDSGCHCSTGEAKSCWRRPCTGSRSNASALRNSGSAPGIVTS